jgi:lysine 2,3-aminomutase
MDISRFCPDYLLSAIPSIFEMAYRSNNPDEFRRKAAELVFTMRYETFDEAELFSDGTIVRIRDCAQAISQIFTRRSEEKAQFSMVQAIMDMAHHRPRPDLSPAFYADILHLFLGLEGKGPRTRLADHYLIPSQYEGRDAALERSSQLDRLSAEVDSRLSGYADGLAEGSVERRKSRRDHILKILKASLEDWYDWQWQYRNILKDRDQISRLVGLSSDEKEAIEKARKARVPFGITPHYLSLMDDDPNTNQDQAIRAQVIPPLNYIEQITKSSFQDRSCLDFMKEGDTSPIDLITRHYPSICIFKPFNTCPQICVYCQRNWEIEDAMIVGALASEDQIDQALKWISGHPAIHEVLITGGDPLGMNDSDLEHILSRVAAIPSIERIRIGTRTLVTAPMRITTRLVDLLAKFRISGKRQIAIVTHIQHPYELTPDTVEAVERLRARGIAVFNQLVYTFFVSRRFEAACLRRNLSRIGVEPYYVFNTKGKEETIEYRVPIARLLQEQKEEARLLPGIARTDEAVYNVSGMGKNYLRARQHRDLISILPDGARLYEFHPWEKNITKNMSTHIGQDVPILDYLIRLDGFGEDVSDYETIWYYY